VDVRKPSSGTPTAATKEVDSPQLIRSPSRIQSDVIIERGVLFVKGKGDIIRRGGRDGRTRGVMRTCAVVVASVSGLNVPKTTSAVTPSPSGDPVGSHRIVVR
jgi:hypothetical protein